MNEKTARQIEEMKKQTIGVEVEMNNITRKEAAEVAANFFGTNRCVIPFENKITTMMKLFSLRRKSCLLRNNRQLLLFVLP